jgi:type VI protein secretion system component VasF
MNAKHTPGPWSYRQSREGSQTVYIVGYGPVAAIARVPISEADAAIIAAAPDLLSTLRELADPDTYESPSKLREAAIRARAAIAKAEGQQ